MELINGDTKVTYNNKTFKESRLAIGFKFFRVFTLPFIKGDAKTALMEPHAIVLTKISRINILIVKNRLANYLKLRMKYVK